MGNVHTTETHDQQQTASCTPLGHVPTINSTHTIHWVISLQYHPTHDQHQTAVHHSLGHVPTTNSTGLGHFPTRQPTTSSRQVYTIHWVTSPPSTVQGWVISPPGNPRPTSDRCTPFIGSRPHHQQYRVGSFPHQATHDQHQTGVHHWVTSLSPEPR